MNIKSFYQFITEGKIPTKKVKVEDVLSLLDDGQVSFSDIFEFTPDSIDDLDDNSEFEKILNKKGFKQGWIEDTDNMETFLPSTSRIRFIFIYKDNAIQIEEPEYIVLQYNKKVHNSDVLLFKNDGNSVNLFEILSEQTIEVGKDKHVYKTYNSGNNWELVGNPKGKFKKEMDKDELKKNI